MISKNKAIIKNLTNKQCKSIKNEIDTICNSVFLYSLSTDLRNNSSYKKDYWTLRKINKIIIKILKNNMNLTPKITNKNLIEKADLIMYVIEHNYNRNQGESMQQLMKQIKMILTTNIEF